MRPSSSSTASSPAFARFAAAAERHIDDPHAIADHLSILLSEGGWLSPRDQRPGIDSYRQHLLYVSPTRRLSVVALVWQPGQRTPIHDHIAWCVVGVYRGVEHEIRYRLVEEDGEPALVPTGSVDAYPGHVEALAEPFEDIHCVTAGGDEKAISIHVYGADIEARGPPGGRTIGRLRPATDQEERWRPSRSPTATTRSAPTSPSTTPRARSTTTRGRSAPGRTCTWTRPAGRSGTPSS